MKQIQEKCHTSALVPIKKNLHPKIKPDGFTRYRVLRLFWKKIVKPPTEKMEKSILNLMTSYYPLMQMKKNNSLFP